MSKYPKHLVMIAQVRNLQYDSRVIQMVNSFCEAGSKVSIVVPPQESDNTEVMSGLMHKSAKIVAVKDGYFKEAACGDLSSFLGKSFSNFQQRLFTRYLSGDTKPYEPSINEWPSGLRHLGKITSDLWYQHVRKTKDSALAEGNFWYLYFQQQLPPKLFKKYASTFRLDVYNYFYYIQTLLINKSEPIDCIFCTDLWTLPVGCLIKELLNTTLIYDSHEIGTASIDGASLKEIAAANEKWMYELCDRFITVNDSLADFYHKLCPSVEPVVLTNARQFVWTPASNQPTIKEQLSLASNIPVAVYLGSLHPLSHMDRFIEAIPHSRTNMHLAILGGGGDIERFQKISQELGLTNKRVFFLGRVSFQEVQSKIYGADFGIIPNIQTHMNLTLISSSKLYDYVQAELPFISDYGPEIQKIVDEFEIGKTVNFQQDSMIIAKQLDDFYDEVHSGKFSPAERQRAKQALVWPTNVLEIAYPSRAVPVKLAATTP